MAKFDLESGRGNPALLLETNGIESQEWSSCQHRDHLLMWDTSCTEASPVSSEAEDKDDEEGCWGIEEEAEWSKKRRIT